MKRLAWRVSGFGAAVTVVALLLLLPPAASIYYEASGGESCAKCHEIRPVYDTWRASSHRNVPCRSCHGDALTFEAGFHVNNLRRVAAHVPGRASKRFGVPVKRAPGLGRHPEPCSTSPLPQELVS